jgi:hypothetical protein
LTTREPHQKSNILRVKDSLFSYSFVFGNKPLNTWSQRRDSNPRPTDYKSVALPAELRWHIDQILKIKKKTDGKKYGQQKELVLLTTLTKKINTDYIQYKTNKSEKKGY